MTRLSVRARCGGQSTTPDGGAALGSSLWGWSSRRGGAWTQLASNQLGISSAGSVDADAGFTLEFTQDNAAEARTFLLERDREMAFQCRPLFATQNSEREASVVMERLWVNMEEGTP